MESEKWKMENRKCKIIKVSMLVKNRLYANAFLARPFRPHDAIVFHNPGRLAWVEEQRAVGAERMP